MTTAPRNTPVMLKMRDSLGIYECGPFERSESGQWMSCGGRYRQPLIGTPIGWRSIEETSND